MTTSSLTKKWRDAFIIELRLRGADGKQIGDELAQVESHCLDAGVPVDEAFGDPVAYARSVVVADGGSPALSAKDGRQLVQRTLAQAIGLMVLLESVPALRDGRQVMVTVADVLMVGVLAGLLVLLVTKADAVLTFLARSSVVVIGLLGAVLFALLVLIALSAAPALVAVGLAGSSALAVPATLAAGAGALMLLLPSVIRSRFDDDDAIVVPLSEAPAPPARRWLDLALRWWVPVVGLALCAVVWFVL